MFAWLATGGLLVVFAVVATSAWMWLGTQQSAATLAASVNRWVPGLQLTGVTGSVRGNAHIEKIHWQYAGSQATAHNVNWHWRLQLSPTQVWQHWVRGNTTANPNYPALTATLTIDQLALVLAPQPETNTTPLTLPGDLALPIAVDIGLRIAQTTVAVRGGSQTLSHIDAHYHYAGGQSVHQLAINTLQWQALSASAQLSVHTRGSWPLSGHVSVNTQTTELAKQLAGRHAGAPQNLAAKFTLQGNLATTSTNDATPPRLALHVSAHANEHQLLSAAATVYPFEAQPIQAVSAQLNQLDLAAWLPANSGIPATSISGTAHIAPAGQTHGQTQWRGRIELTQPASERLPSAAISANVTLDTDHVAIGQLALFVTNNTETTQTKAWLKGHGSMQLETGQINVKLQGHAPGLSLQTAISASTRLSMPYMPVGNLTLNVSDAATLTRWLHNLTHFKQLPSGLGLNPQGAVMLTAHLSNSGQVDVHLSATELATTLNKQRVQLKKGSLRMTNTWQQLNVALNLDARAPGVINAASAQLHTQLSIHPAALPELSWRDLSWQLAVVDADKRSWYAATSSPWRGTYVKGLAAGNAAGIKAGTQSCVLKQCLAQLNWQAWTASHKAINIKGTINNLHAAVLSTLTPHATPNWRSSLVAGGTWLVHMGPDVKPNVRLQLARTSGDIEIGTTVDQWQAIGLGDVTIGAQWRDKTLDATVSAVSQLTGTVTAYARTQLVANGWGIKDTPNAALSGALQLKLDDLSRLSPWLSPTVHLGGRLQADITLGGTQGQPQPTGWISASGLSARHPGGDFDVGGGEVKVRLDNSGVDIERLYIHGVGDATQGGYAIANGHLNWPTSTPTQRSAKAQDQLTLKLLGFQAAAKADRRISVSGDLVSHWRDQRLSVSGGLRIDKASIALGTLGAPSLGDDVVVVGSTKPATTPALPLDLNINLSLGEAFRVTGFGLTTSLRGTLHISGPDTHNQPILNGEVNAVNARYKAYGQDLIVKRGRLLFAGRPDTPQLDILAVRALTEPQVGVQVQGPLNAPRVALYANTAMADSEKLSWLLLGHPSARGGSEAALIQNAVLALVGDTNALLGSVDEFSIEGQTKLSDGSTRAAQLTVGKQLGERLYTSYTRSVASVQGLLSVYLKLTNSLALRAQTGESNNVDLVWSRAYD